VASSTTNLIVLAMGEMDVLETHINPDWSLGNQTSVGAVLQLCSNKAQHVFATPKESDPGCIVYIGLCLVEALLLAISSVPSTTVLQTYQSILLVSSPIASVRFQETAIDKFQIGLKASGRLLVAR
jgi:hypothetical protein